ncbi:PREDICTED: uncharacterized protein LOC104719495 [Camelina sativa]|uniref:Uncharacterized protein LOC104719495 n=1 Tax=Camelina sativa TaxID=90675 RepID=A0ABM0U4L1_CAMSA|nr:PREDICTED: uncharacterized protein LOC104719495 [Camelina sativa]
MADIISKPSMEQLFFSVDPMSLILSQNSDTHQLNKLLLDGFSGFERGPRYDEYSKLRESKLRMKRDFQKYLDEKDVEEEPRIKKQVRFEGNSVISPEKVKFSAEEKKKQSRFGLRKAVPSSLAQSVPDFSAVLRKENRRPVSYNTTTTPPPPASKSRNGSVLSGSVSRGSKSASAGEKKSKGMMMMGMARKSYANVEDLKKISMAAASAINGSGGGGGGGGRRVGDGGGGGRRTILGYRQIY